MTLHRGLSLVNSGKLAEARQLLEADPELTASDPEALRLLAKLVLNDGETATAWGLMQQVATACPERADIQYELGVIAIQIPDRDAAAQAWNTAVRLCPEMPQAHYNLGCLHRQQGAVTAAEAAFLTTVRQDPNHAQAWFNLGNIRFERGDAAGAVDAYRRAGGENSTSTDLLIKLSQALLQMGLTDQAMAVARRADGLAPNHPVVSLCLAANLEATQHWAEAVEVLRQCHAAHPGNLDIVGALIRSLSRRGEYKGALDVLDRFLDVQPGHPEALSLLEQTYQALDIRPLDLPPDQPPLDGFALASTEVVEVYEGCNKYWFNTVAVRNEQKPTFLVLTSGNCGAIWLASAMNLHDEIFAGCGIDHPIESCFRYNLQKSGPDLVKVSRPEHYRYGTHIDAMRPPLLQQGLDYDLRPRAYHRLPWYVFDELEQMPGADRLAAIGSIHAFSAAQFSRYFKRDRHVLGNRRVVVTNMIRHPIPRIESFIKAFTHYHRDSHRGVIDTYIETHLDECLGLERQYGISMQDPKVRAVLFSYRIGFSAGWVARELKRFRGMVALKMEDLQNDRDYFARAFTLLTSGQVAASPSYLDKVFLPENLGVGRRGAIADGTRPPAAALQWQEWSDWERAEFLKCFHREHLGEIYGAYDYDFSFLR